MTPWLLFEYILAVVCGLGFGALIVMYVFANMIDWDKYEANKRRSERR